MADDTATIAPTENRFEAPPGAPTLEWNERGELLVNGRVMEAIIMRPKEGEPIDSQPVIINPGLMQSRGPLGVLNTLEAARTALQMVFTQQFQTANADAPRVVAAPSYSERLAERLRGVGRK